VGARLTVELAGAGRVMGVCHIAYTYAGDFIRAAIKSY
jgi:hypothetical protein